MKRILLLGVVLAPLFSDAQFWKFTDPEQLKGTVNSEAEESIPVFSKDSSALYFVRTFDEKNKGNENDQDIWVSYRDENGGYSDSKQVKRLNNKFNNAVLGMNGNGTRIYLINSYEGKKDLKKGVAFSEYKGSSWSSPEAILIPGLDITGDFYGFHVNEKEDVMIISYKGPGSLGDEDLYVCTKSGDSWSTPLHMGNKINSSGYEISPFLNKSQDTLFFSTNGMGGEGDADIFYSVRQGNWTEWSDPVNLGPAINSPKFDAYFIHSGSQAYWSSNRGDLERSDIWMINILTPPPLVVSCTATDATVYNGTDGSIDLTIESGAEPYSFEWSNGETTEDLLALATGEYLVTVTDDVGQKADAKCFVDAPPKPIEPVVVIEYENLEFKHFFGYNKNKLSTSRGELKKFVKDIIAQFEEGRENITINIHSSASQVPTKTFGTNDKLASARAENMKYDLVEYFQKKGYAEKVNVVIVKTEVQGPAYEDDSSNRDKYKPYQFVGLKTE
jgi:hypothetical protein